MRMGCCERVHLFLRRMRFLWMCGDTRPATICVILSGFLWGGLLLMPGETVDRPTYRIMKAVLSTDEAWAVVFLTVATLQLVRLFAVTTSRSKWWDFSLKIMACGVYSFTAIACILSISPVPAAMADNAVIALAAWWDLSRWEMVRGCGSTKLLPHGECPLDRSFGL